MENNAQFLASKLVDSSYDSIGTIQPEDSPKKSEYHNNVIPFRLKPSGKVNTEKSEISDNAMARAENAEVSQGSIVKQVLNKAINDQDFWVDLLENGSVALSEFKLSSKAKTAIASGDVQWVYKNVGDLPERQMAFLYKRLEREAW